jgi:DNA-binding response OmpR family regulator/nitrogen-specific signal transduction histidine kinase
MVTEHAFEMFLFASLSLVVVILCVLYLYQRTHNKKVSLLNDKLRESDRLKSKLLADVSHELRTPLTLILTPIEDKLATPRLSASDKKTFQLISRNARRLLSLTNQLLDLSKLEAMKIDLHVQQGDLKLFINGITSSFDSLSEHRGIEFKKLINFSFPETWFDSDKIEKIINNLLSNAIKFTPKQGIVTLSVENYSASSIILSVGDTGKGIPAGEQEHVFQPFYQGRQTEDEFQNGTGLGLPLVKELVKLYGGSIELKSEVDRGTIISVILPVAREKFDEAFIDKASPANAETKTIPEEETWLKENELVSEGDYANSILIVEDNHGLRNYLASKLADRFTIFTATNGEEGFEVAVENIPNLIISDVMMPKMDGIDLTNKLKSDGRTSHIPIVLLTAKVDDESKLLGLQTGADDYLLKPFNISELKLRINNLIENRRKLAIKYRSTLSQETNEPGVGKEIPIDEKFLETVRRVIEENIGNNQFGVEQLADEVHLSRTHLFRKLKALANVTPVELISDIRLQKAAELLRARGDSITQISYDVGFREQSYFAKRFRKKFGVNPSEYQAKYDR